MFGTQPRQVHEKRYKVRNLKYAEMYIGQYFPFLHPRFSKGIQPIYLKLTDTMIWLYMKHDISMIYMIAVDFEI